MSARLRPRALAAMALLAALALALGACGGGDSSTTDAAAVAGPDSEQVAEFESCIEENGGTLPELGAPAGAPPSASSSGAGSSTEAPQPQTLDEDTQAALDACSELMPAPPAGAPVGAPAAPPDS